MATATFPAVGTRVRILKGCYRGQWGTVVSYDESEWSCYLVSPDATDSRNVWLSPYEIEN